MNQKSGSLFNWLVALTMLSGLVTSPALAAAQTFARSPAADYRVEGAATDSTTGWPLYARITINGYPGPAIWTDPETGYYSIDLPEGVTYTFNVEAWVPGYLPISREIAPLTGNVTEDFALDADLVACTAPGYTFQFDWSEDFEASDGGFTVSGATTTWEWGAPTSGPGAAHSGVNVWATNLNGDYLNNENGTITSPLIDLSSYAGAAFILEWYQWAVTESSYDEIRVEASNNGGASWNVVYGPLSGSISPAWSKVQAVLSSSYAVSSFQVRFHFTSDSISVRPGWYIDDIGISAQYPPPPAVVYSENFDAADGGYTHAGTQDEWGWGVPSTAFPGGCNGSSAGCWDTDLAGNYADSADYSLYSPVIDLSGVNLPPGSSLFLKWAQAIHIESASYDHADAFASLNGAADSTLWSHTGSDRTEQWNEKGPFDISTAAGGSLQLKFRLTSDSLINFEGWSVDDVQVYYSAAWTPAVTCAAPSGGLVVGNVYDRNTLTALNGASIETQAGASVTTVATPEDGAVDDGFYTAYSPAGSQVFTATYSAGYAPEVQAPGVLAGDTVRQDFYLEAGRLIVTPTSLSAILQLGQSSTTTLRLENSGGPAISWEIFEQDGGYQPLRLGSPRSPESSPFADTAPIKRQILSPVALGDELFRVDMEAVTGHSCLLGVEFAMGDYWVTSGGQGTCADPNILFQIDTSGNVVNSWDQNTTPADFGWRDLAFDGSYLYASDSDVIVQIDPATGATTGVTIPAPTNPARALAYDPATDHFWTANFSSSIWEFDRSGAVINTFPNSLTVYGAAWDVLSRGGPYLWVWSQDGTPAVLATRIDPTNGQQTGVAFQGSSVSGDDAAGGATITPDLVPGRLALVGLHQATPDNVVVYDLDVDVAWLSENPTSGILPGSTPPPPYKPQPAALVKGVPGAAQENVGAEAPATVGAPSPIGLASKPFHPEAVLYDNGPLVTHPGGGSGGADASAVQTALLMSTNGFAHSVSTGFRVADDFTITDPDGWTIDQITFFAYQTGSTTSSTINQVNLRIWDGPPGAPNSQVVFGDTFTNHLSNTTWSNIYRVLDTDLTNTERPVMADTAVVGTSLPPGIYWLDWQTGGTLASGPWAPPVSILGQSTTGNALQYDSTIATWVPLNDTGSQTQQDLPFTIEGSENVGKFQDIEITFDAVPPAVSQPGQYLANLRITNDTPYGAVIVPVTLTVTAPFDWGKVEGTVRSQGYCDADPALLEGAEVVIVDSGGMTYTLATGANGYYSYWLPATASPLSITVNAPEHTIAQASGVIIAGGGTTTQDIDLRWLQPCVDVAPPSLDVTVAEGYTQRVPLVVINSGAEAADWTVSEMPASLRVPEKAAPLESMVMNVTGELADLDVPWLSENPISGAIPADDQAPIDVTFDSMTYTVGTYPAFLKVASDDPFNSPVVVPVTMTVVPVAYGVAASLVDDSLSAMPGETVTYTLMVTNTSNGPVDTFDVAVSGETWTTTVPAVVGPLDPGESAMVDVSVVIPVSASGGDQDVATCTVTSQGNPTVFADVMLTTTVVLRSVFLPLVMNGYLVP